MILQPDANIHSSSAAAAAAAVYLTAHLHLSWKGTLFFPRKHALLLWLPGQFRREEICGSMLHLQFGAVLHCVSEMLNMIYTFLVCLKGISGYVHMLVQIC